MLPLFLFIMFAFVYPLYVNISMSFEKYGVAAFVSGKAPFVGLKNYVDVFSNPLMAQTVINTVIFTAGSLLFQFAFGLLLALHFRRSFPGGQLLRTLVLIPWLLPLIVSATTFRWMLDYTNGIVNQMLAGLHVIGRPLGWLIDPHLALVSVIITNVWIGIPFNMVLLYGGLMNIPIDFYEAASMDGAKPLQQFWYITLPSLKDVIMIVLMLGLIYTLKVFDVVKVLTGGGPANSTQILSTWSYALSFTDLSFGEGAAVGNVLIAVSMVFAVIYLRFGRMGNSGER